MTREELSQCFLEGLVFGRYQIAAYEPERYEESGTYPTGRRVDFDTAYNILTHNMLEEVLEFGSAILTRHIGDAFFYQALVEAVEEKKDE